MTRIFCALLLCLALAPAAWARGVALVIGNARYANVSELDNPANDVTSVADALRDQGFEVFAHTDLGRVEMRNALRDFRRLADESDVALVYYAGHGIEIAGVNYLVPVDARLEDERDAGLEMVEVDPRNFLTIEPNPDCRNAEEEPRPVRNFTPGMDNALMLLRACLKYKPMMPTTGLGKELNTDTQGYAQMIVTSAFVQEPR